MKKILTAALAVALLGCAIVTQAETDRKAIDIINQIRLGKNTKWQILDLKVKNGGTFGSNVTFAVGFTATGSVAIVGALNLGTNLTVGGNLSVTGPATFVSTLSAEHLTSTDDATVVDDMTIGGDLTATGAVTHVGTLTQQGAATFASTITSTGLVNGVAGFADGGVSGGDFAITNNDSEAGITNITYFLGGLAVSNVVQ